jgi:hypothetical protein
MERAGLATTTIDARVRRVFPGLARAALWLALACACAPFLPELVAEGSPAGSPIVAATRDAATYWLLGAAALAASAWLASRGFTEPAQIRLDARCIYIVAGRIERRAPRWMIQDVAVSSRRREVHILLSSGKSYQLLFATPDAAHKLADALTAPRPRKNP